MYSYMYLALIYQACICTCISTCNFVRTSTNVVTFMLIVSQTVHKEIVYMQNLHIITFNTEGNEKHQHDIMLS